MDPSNNQKKKQIKQQKKQRRSQKKQNQQNTQDEEILGQVEEIQEQEENIEELENNSEENLQIQAPENNQRKLIIILHKAPLEVGKLNKKFELINGDDHRQYISHKLKEDFAKYRPDILHQCLLTIFDSPLNKMGMVQVYIQTEKNILIEINPQTKIPRTYKRFAALFGNLIPNFQVNQRLELLKKVLPYQKQSKILLQIIFHLIAKKLVSNSLFFIKIKGTSCKARLVNIKEYFSKLPNKEPIVFVVGAVAAGNAGVEVDFLDDSICISKYPLSAACCLFKIVNEFEELWVDK